MARSAVILTPDQGADISDQLVSVKSNKSHRSFDLHGMSYYNKGKLRLGSVNRRFSRLDFYDFGIPPMVGLCFCNSCLSADQISEFSHVTIKENGILLHQQASLM
jgi:hypothetical protein